MNNAKHSFKLQKESIKALKEVKSAQAKLPVKLATVKGCKDSERELFLVEGESAEGTARNARMTTPYRFQETLGLRGKIPNAYKTNSTSLMNNKEILAVLAAIGYDPQSDDPLANLRVGKIILLSDPVPDGLHINALLLAFFSKILPATLMRKMVFAVVSPKYVLNDNGIQYFGMTVKSVKKQLPKKTDPSKMTYLKGWGEASAASMRSIAFDPKVRRLITIKPPKQSQLDYIESLMGFDSQIRKELLGV